MPEILQNKFVIGAIIIGFVVMGWFILSSSTSTSSSTSIVQGTSSDASSVSGVDLVQALTSLQNVNLDNSFFTNPVFASLKDYSRQVTNEPVGRHDPFAPVGTVAAQQNAATQDQTVSQIQSATVTSATNTKPTQTKPKIPAKR